MRKLWAIAFGLFVIVGLAQPASAATSRHFYVPYYSASSQSMAGDVSINGGQVCIRLADESVGAYGYASARAYNSAGQLIFSLRDDAPGTGYVCGSSAAWTKVTAGIYSQSDSRFQYAYNMSNTSSGVLVSDFTP